MKENAVQKRSTIVVFGVSFFFVVFCFIAIFGLPSPFVFMLTQCVSVYLYNHVKLEYCPVCIHCGFLLLYLHDELH